MTAHDQSNQQDYTRNPADFSDYVIALIDSREDAQRAAEALHAAGFANEDIVLSPEAEEGTHPLEKSKGMEDTLAEPPTTGEKLFTEEGIEQEQYAEERAKGHVAVRVHTPRDEEVASAREVLAEHHAYAIRHVGQLAREILSDEPERSSE